MNHWFKNFLSKQSKILVIEPSMPVRQVMVDVLRKSGFRDIHNVASFREGISLLEVEDVHWILSSVFNDDKDANGLQLLRLMLSQYELRATRVSMFFSQEEVEDILIPAYQLGLMNHMILPFDKKAFQAWLEDFQKLIHKEETSPHKVTMTYLSSVLETLHPGSLEDLYEALSVLDPQEGMYFFHLAKIQLERSSKKASKNLAIARMLGVSEEICASLEPNSEKNWQPKGILIVDPDEASRTTIEEGLSLLKAEDLWFCANGEEAWDLFQKHQKSCELILLEWRLPKLSGPYLIQRIRMNAPSLPIILVSSLVQKGDQPLVEEIGIQGVIEKPFERKIFAQNLMKFINLTSSEEESLLETKIHLLLEEGRLEDAKVFWKNYQEGEGPKEKNLVLMAHFAYMEGHYHQAKDWIQIQLSKKSDIRSLNLLGKCFLKMGYHDEALVCYKKAQDISPKNIKRLCEMAEIERDLGEEEKSNQLLEEAKQQDEQAPAVQEAEALMLIREGEGSSAKNAILKGANLHRIIANINNRGVLEAKKGRFEESQALYDESLKALPEGDENRSFYQGILHFNKALGFLRSKNTHDSIKQLESTIATNHPILSEKARNLLVQLNRILISHSAYEVTSQLAEENEPSEDVSLWTFHKGYLEKLEKEIPRGDMALFGIFRPLTYLGERAKNWLSKSPHYKNRRHSWP